MTHYRERLLDYLRRKDRGWVLALLAAACIVYLPFLGNPFMFDDMNFFGTDYRDYYADAGFHFDLRWLAYATLGRTYAVFSDVDTYFYHLGNLLFHAAAAIVLFYLLRELVAAATSSTRDAPEVVWGAWLGAAIFAVHPLAVYAAGYIIQRSIVMATLFVLLMQLAYLRAILTGQRRWLPLAVAAYVLAVYSKEHSVLAPALLAAETILLRGKLCVNSRSLWLTWAALAMVGLHVVLLAKGVIGTAYESAAPDMFAQQHLVGQASALHILSTLTQAGLFFKYLLLALFPNPAWMSVDMREPFIASMSAWQGWVGAIAFLAYGAVGAWLLWRPRWAGLTGLALLYPWLQFLLEFSSVRVQEIFVLYRAYLWLPGLMLLVPVLVARWPGRRTLAALGLAVVLLLPLAWNRLWVFADGYRLWDDAAKLLRTGDEPLASRIFYNRANEAGAKGQWAAAAADYERAVAHWDGQENAVLHHDLGVAYFNTGRYQDALVQLDKAVTLDPKYAKAYFDLGLTLKRLDQGPAAKQQIEKSCELRYAIACLVLNRSVPK